MVRGRQRTGAVTSGRTHAYAIRETLDPLLRTFPIRTCSDNKFHRHQRLGRPCLLYHIEKCSGPCIGAVEPEAYAEMVTELMSSSPATPSTGRQLEAEMRAAPDRSSSSGPRPA